MKSFIQILSFLLLTASCGSSESNAQSIAPNAKVVTVQTKVDYNGILSCNTDKALYRPGEVIHFSASGTLPSDCRVRYRSIEGVIDDQPLGNQYWEWVAPNKDFCGYMVEIYTSSSDKETIYGTIAVDVSSDWNRFPRYGFVASYDASKTDGVIAEEMAFLNRCHINGIQYYDWHYKHHWPLGGKRGDLLDTYTDIAYRSIVTDVIRKYISCHHAYGMKTMFYNLCYGALDDAPSEGVKDQWYMYKQPGHTDKDVLLMSNSWKSNIYLMNPGNPDWQKYIVERNDDVYASFDFDGYHIDQVGERGSVYDYDGNTINLPKGFSSFISEMKKSHPNKRLVTNAVASFGASQIASTGCVDFLYNELWDSESQFSDLLKVRKANSLYSNNQLQTMFAAYMNYDKQSGDFNTPGVLLTDAVMFTIGGAHLELGDGHMLCHEYFPNSRLKISEALRQSLISYYDFLTAYQNLLRGNGLENVSDIVSEDKEKAINAWPPQLKQVTTYSKEVGNRQIIHLLNFRQANRLSWRDMDGSMPEPLEISNLPLVYKTNRDVNRIWVASPDYIGGARQEVSFVQKDGEVRFSLPALKYWTMIVIE